MTLWTALINGMGSSATEGAASGAAGSMLGGGGGQGAKAGQPPPPKKGGFDMSALITSGGKMSNLGGPFGEGGALSMFGNNKIQGNSVDPLDQISRYRNGSDMWKFLFA